MDHVYTIPGFDISALNEIFVQRHSGESLPVEQKGFRDLNIESIGINSALFSHLEEAGSIETWLVQQDTGLYLSCSCAALTEKLCRHQSRALLAISRRTELRIFFDAALRHEKLRDFALPYGLQQEQNLDTYFRVEYANGQNVIRPASANLFPLNREYTLQLQDQFSAGNQGSGIVKRSEDHIMLLVFKQHKYYKHLIIELAEASLTQSGKPKNPVVPVNALEKIWNAVSPAESKFFSAVHLFRNKAADEQPGITIEALKAILKNPLGLPLYRHEAAVSENMTAASLSPLQTGHTLYDLQLQVVKNDPFYELTAELDISGSKCRLEDTSVQFGYFLAAGPSLHLIGNTKLLNVISFLKKHQDKLLIHQSKYHDFRDTVLSRLEESTAIDYAYLPPASLEQLMEHQLDKAPEKLLYLADSGAYVELNPVMRYGDIEIPVLSKKQIYPKGIKTGFRVNRDKEAEIAFTSLVMRQHPYFHEQVEEQLPYFYLHKKHFLDEKWFLDAFEEWQNKGIRIFGFNKLQKNSLNPHKAKITVRILSGTDWFNAEIALQYGNKKASLKQVHKAIRNKSKYVRLGDGTMGILPEEWIEKFRDYFSAGEVTDNHIRIAKVNFRAVGELFEEEVLDNAAKKELALLESKLANLEGMEEAEVPAELNAHLRAYQKQGLSWLNFLDDHRFGGCLADDMGLGKTLQIIAFLLLQRQKRGHTTSLLLVPTSLVFNWKQEIDKFAPSLKVFTHYGPDRNGHTREFGDHELIITTYGTLLSDISFLKDFSFNYIFADESQNIKNPDSQRYQAARLLKSANRIAITGTPVENNTFDLFGQLSFACPGLLGSKQYFKEIYAVPIDQFKDRKRSRELQEKVRPFILRRTKKQVAGELPEKTEMVLFCEMPPEQQKIYTAFEKEFRDYICSKTNEELPKSSVHVLKGLTRLRQICNSPLLLNDEEINVKESGKMNVLLEQLLSKSANHKILVFSQFVSMLDLVKKELEERGIGYSYLCGSTRNREQVVREFQSEDTRRIFLISLKAGGNGLNLTPADYVYLIDPWWNPAVENQAIDRIYRIGQKKNVVAVRLICSGTIEEKIMNLQETKKELFHNLIRKDNLLKLLELR
ncbi:SNF2 family DNA or RNA helicase [Anseongella ginsenosidimutans]|uniref:SNF2 family DNA or RNA helicase n=1 Tax=Anseongella ginsenosidimutans TaxID=496056 RepID=A0A4R3KR20_9SPHI|nr:DEAD/DEAH box helicase [Anseongella ginsenosidimutans]QEC53728.1 DEAD/DEAH box helicase [Anseongella ginsenosidimutans]TCS86018.1 SNF2 family DNA or RNA helicase [Anseongella ginsenosidimutans]